MVAVVFAWLSARRDREMSAFIGLGAFLVLGVVAIFGSVYPVVLPSTLDDAWHLTVSNASSSDYTLKLMTIVAAIGVPLVLGYQAWSYWIFRHRISEDHIPEPHEFLPAILRAPEAR